MGKGAAISALGVVLVGAVGTWVYFTPYIALRGMRAAAAAGDAAELSSYVDFPAVRGSLKATLTGKVAAVTQNSDNPLAAFGAAFANTLADPLIDALVTPASLALVLNGVSPQPSGAPSPAPVGADTETTTSYDGVNSFVVTVTNKALPGRPIGLVLSRSGLVSWKLSAITLP